MAGRLHADENGPRPVDAHHRERLLDGIPVNECRMVRSRRVIDPDLPGHGASSDEQASSLV